VVEELDGVPARATRRSIAQSSEKDCVESERKARRQTEKSSDSIILERNVHPQGALVDTIIIDEEPPPDCLLAPP